MIFMSYSKWPSTLSTRTTYQLITAVDNYYDVFCLKTLDLHFPYSILVLKLK